MVKARVAAGGRVNGCTTSPGLVNTALDFAILLSRLQIIEYLLSLGGRAWGLELGRGKEGSPPLHTAVSTGNPLGGEGLLASHGSWQQCE